MNLEKTEMLICSGAINSAGVVFAEILMKLRRGGGGAEGRVTVLGGAVGAVVLHSLPESGTVFFPPKQWQIISNAHQPSRLPWDVPISVFMIYFPFLYLKVSQHFKPILCLYCCMITALFMDFMNHI